MIEEWTADPAESPFNDCPVCCQLDGDCKCVKCAKCEGAGSTVDGDGKFHTCKQCYGYGILRFGVVNDG